MGTRLWLCVLKEETIQLLIKDPSRIETAVESIAKPPSVRGLSPLVRLLKQLSERQRAAIEGDSMDIDKAWHGLHYLLTGTAWTGDPPLNFILAGGTEATDNEGRTTRLYSSSQLREINRALKSVDRPQLQAAYDAAAMMSLDIYPGIWARDAHAFEYCVDHFSALKRFVSKAAHQSDLGMVTILS
jgi:hypothetical protein